MSLNTAIHQGSKLQRDLRAVLARFRKYPVAMVWDVAETYLRIWMAPQDRKYYRFIWGNMDQTKQPDVFESNILVFGVNSAPSETQLVSQ